MSKTLKCLAVIAGIFLLAVPAMMASMEFEGSVDGIYGQIGGVSELIAYNDYNEDGHMNDGGEVYLRLDDEEDWGFRLNLHFKQADGPHGFGATFWTVDLSSDVKEYDDDEDLYFLQLDQFYYYSDLDGYHARGSTQADMTYFDVFYSYTLGDSTSNYLRLKAGAAIMDYSQNENHCYNDDSSRGDWNCAYEVDANSDRDGYGPVFGVSGSHQIGSVEGLTVFGSTSTAYIMGDHNASRKEKEDGSAANIDIDRNDEKTGIIGEVNLGIQYAFDFGMTLRAGYFAAWWPNMPRTEISTEYDYYTFDERERDVSFSGWFVGLGFIWGAE